MEEIKIFTALLKVLKENYICDHCLGRCVAQLLSGLTNEQRGHIIRYFLAFLVDSGEKLNIEPSNFYGIKFRNVKIEAKKPGKCFICQNFFEKKIDEIAKKILEKIKKEKFEFETFLIGSIPTQEMLKSEDEILEIFGIEFVESIKAEINRELGKRLEKITGKKVDFKLPDLSILVDLNTESIRIQVRSLYVFGKYQKLVRGIPQSKWICPKCKGKGCIACEGKGKLYPTSVQEIIEKPLLKAAKAKKTKFSAAGREDIDARCLDFRPFVLELIKPLKRKFNLRKIQKEINKSKKVKVKGLKFVQKRIIRQIKSERVDKTYLAQVEFEKNIDKKLLKNLKELTKQPILQKTPLRVVHRRAEKVRKRLVKKISYKLAGRKKLILKIRAQAGLYIKELITGDEGRTKPNIAEQIQNRPKKILLDVIKIHS
jgi:tRNA pseudouridine synthase 10